MTVKASKHTHIRIVFPLHHILKYFLGYSLGRIFQQMKTFIKIMTKHYGGNIIVIMIRKMMNG